MSDPMPPSPQPPSPPPEPQDRYASARIPEKVMRGVTATGCLAFFGPNEFVIDFLQVFAKPVLVARVVMSHGVAEQFLSVLRENYARYQAQFGAPPQPFPRPASERPRTAQEIYDDIKVPDDMLSGVYANNVLVGHTPAEFGVDFITGFMPYAAVSARIYVAAPRVPQIIDTINGLLINLKRQHAPPPSSTPGMPPGDRPPPPPPENYGTAPGVPGFPTPP